MLSLLKRIWLTLIFIILTTLAVVWTFAGYRRLIEMVKAMQAPIVVEIPELITPTQTPLPPTPSGPFGLTFNFTDQALESSTGKPIFVLTSNNEWAPFVPIEIAETLLMTAQPKKTADGSWILYKDGQLAFQWNPVTWSWDEAPKSTPISIDKVLEPYQFTIKDFSMEKLHTKIDADLISLAPEIKGADFGLGDGFLLPSEIVHFGESGDIPYLLYADQQGRVRLGWNIAEEELEHIEQSFYKDPLSGLTVRALLVTDFSMTVEGKRWYALEEPSDGGLAKAVFEYPISLNYMYTNYRSEFNTMLHVVLDNYFSAMASANPYQVHQLLTKAQDSLRKDYKNLATDESLKVNFRAAKLYIEKKPIVVVFRINLTLPGQRDQYTRIIAGSNYLEIIQNLRRGDYLNYSPYVGGFLIKALREITFLGDTSASVFPSNAQVIRSTADQMILDLCDQKKISAYFKIIAPAFSQDMVVPTYDYINKPLPVCLIVEMRK